MKNDISIGKTLASSFQYLFSNFSKRLKDGFPAVIFITIAFNILNYLMSNKIATNFTVIFFFLFVMRFEQKFIILVDRNQKGTKHQHISRGMQKSG